MAMEDTAITKQESALLSSESTCKVNDQFENVHIKKGVQWFDDTYTK